jgi:Arc/MetJ-type ribon-helix-helix transcriptional regulator
MTISLSKEQEARLQQLIDAGLLESAEELIDYALGVASEQDDAYNDWLRAKLQEAQHDIDQGRIRTYTTDTLHELTEDVKRRGRKRLKASGQQAG